ncbi:ABC transporter permease [Frankia sp. QA3]|uniref:ABC transporter permease n=1 Tax=Frankia sp. QA3 TaxID=710111 RepID=UPI000269BF70|nr:ABC transporter permease [Frankia sp. QA3]EIV92445.1 ABC-type dipeptide/oligopeptide/nickel transport system, permease component [Frankia sp. QA3]
MRRYLARRVGQGIFVIWAAFTAAFIILYLLPGDPVEMTLEANGSHMDADPAAVAALRAEYGFDRSVPAQYGHALWRALHGDFGRSVPTGSPVTHLIADALPQTLALTVVAFTAALVFGGALAVAATYVQRPAWRQMLLSLPPLGVSIPGFWLGLLLLQLLSFRLGWLPATGNEGVRSLILPAVTLAVPTGAKIAQILAKSLQATWQQPFIDVARAKGMSRRHIQFRHALRHASLPALTLTGVTVGEMLAGAVIVETIFSRTGIGRLAQEAVLAKDIPLLEGLVVLSAVTFVLVNLAVDVIYPLVDPRITRISAGAGGVPPDLPVFSQGSAEPAVLEGSRE